MTNEEIYQQYNDFVNEQLTSKKWNTIPHCDSRVLHDPSDCEYCGERPEWQAKRQELKIANTGCTPPDGWIPCEADYKRPPGDDDHRRWFGNRPTSVERDDPYYPEESFASQAIYPDFLIKEKNDN